jgi:hypothetical protein
MPASSSLAPGSTAAAIAKAAAIAQVLMLLFVSELCDALLPNIVEIV